MKTLALSDSTGLHVELLTDLIDGNETFTIYQIQERVAGVLQIGLTDATIARGFDFGIESYHLGEIIEFATENDLTVVAHETGAEDVVIYQGTYYGESIGIDLI